MAVDLGLDDEIQVINNIGQHATGFATALRNFTQRFGSTSSENRFNSAALRTAGTASGNLVPLESTNQFPTSVIPNINANKINAGILPISRGGHGQTGVSTLAELKTALGITGGTTFDGNLTQDTLTLRSGSTTVGQADAKIVVERGTSGSDAEIRFLASTRNWELNDLNDSGTYKQILAANIDASDRGKYLRVNTGSNIADWADIPVMRRNYTETISLTPSASRNFVASGTTAANLLNKIVNINPSATNVVMTLTGFGSNGDGMLVHNASTSRNFFVAGIDGQAVNFTVAPNASVELIRNNGVWTLNDGFKPVAFSLNDHSTSSIADADTIPFRNTTGNISQKITFSDLKTAIGSVGGTTFTPSQTNLYSAVAAIIVGGTDNSSSSTITLREVPTLPVSNQGNNWLRGDGTWQTLPIEAAAFTANSATRWNAAKLPTNTLFGNSAVSSFPSTLTNRLVPNTGTGVLKASAANTFAFGSLVADDIPSLGFGKITGLPAFVDGAEGQVWTKSGNAMVWSTPSTGGGGGNIASGTVTVRAANWTQKNAQSRFTDVATSITLPANYRDYEFIHVVARNGTATGADIAEATHLTEALENANTGTPFRIGGGIDFFFNASTRAMTGANFYEVTLYNNVTSVSGGGLFASDDSSANLAMGDSIHFTDVSDSNNAKQTTFGNALNVAIVRPDTSTSSSKQFVIRAANATQYTRQTGLDISDIPTITAAKGGTGATTAAQGLANLGGVPRPVFEVHATDYTVLNTDYNALIGINSDTAARTVTLPSNLDDEFMCEIFLDGAGTNPVTISIPGGNIVQDASNEHLFTDNPDTVVLRQTGDSVKVHKLIPQNWWRVLPARIIRTELPGGGTSGQVLAKSSSTDYDVNWVTPATGGTTFTPSQSNLYTAVKAILVPGTNTTLSESDSAMTIAVNASGGGGGGGAELPTMGTGFLHRTAANVDPTWKGIVAGDLPTIGLDKGGTNATTAAAARENLGIDDYDYVAVSGNRSLTADDNNKLFDVDTSSASRTISLPANPTDDIEIFVRKDGAANTLTISPGSGDTINGGSSFSVTNNGDIVILRSKGSAGWVAVVSKTGYREVPVLPTTSPTRRFLRGDGTWSSLGLSASEIPDLTASQITSGTFNTARLASGGSDSQVLTRTSSGMAWQDAPAGSEPPGLIKDSPISTVDLTTASTNILAGWVNKAVRIMANFPSDRAVNARSSESTGIGSPGDEIVFFLATGTPITFNALNIGSFSQGSRTLSSQDSSIRLKKLGNQFGSSWYFWD